MQAAALYIRVSTDKQEELSPDAQKRLLLDYAEKHGMLVSERHIFIENGISGKRAEKRPQFQQMIALAKSREHPLDVILVWKFSRFARNQEESIVYKSLLKKNNIEVISISEPLIDGPFGSLIERIIEWMDEYYSIRLAGEVTRGMTEKALRGGYQSGPPLGYRILHSGEIPAIVPEEAEIIKIIFNKYVFEGFTYFQITRYLNDLGFTTRQNNPFERRAIEYIIQNPMYKGYVRWNKTHNSTNTVNVPEEWIIEKGGHEPIISEELFEQAQERMRSEYTPAKSSRPVTEYKHWLTGIIRCSYCGRSLTVTKVRNSQYVRFSCSGYLKGKCRVCNSVSETILLPNIIDALRRIMPSGETEYEKEAPPDIADASLLRQQLNKLNQKEERIKAAYRNGIDSLEEYRKGKESVYREKARIDQQLEQLRNTTEPGHRKEALNRISTIYDIITNPLIDNITKNKALKTIIRKIDFDNVSNRVDIYFYPLA